ncbi:hypothetical protein [Vibrio alginolyticus]|uniref:hypothetical protein n=1 Tax=Vibrio alginolyticus TaxID=663 RepID=UPI0012D73FBA|nr:hypothetical protein [Vibrio alginolyticus]
MISIKHLKTIASRLQKSHKKAKFFIGSEDIFVHSPSLSTYQDIISKSLGYEGFYEAEINLRNTQCQQKISNIQLSKIRDRFHSLIRNEIYFNKDNPNLQPKVEDTLIRAVSSGLERYLRIYNYLESDYSHKELRFGDKGYVDIISRMPNIRLFNGSSKKEANVMVDLSKESATKTMFFDLDSYIGFDSNGIVTHFFHEDTIEAQNVVFDYVGDFDEAFGEGLDYTWLNGKSKISQIIDNTFSNALYLFEDYGVAHVDYYNHCDPKCEYGDCSEVKRTDGCEGDINYGAIEYGALYPSDNFDILTATALCFSDNVKAVLIDRDMGEIVDALRKIKDRIPKPELLAVTFSIIDLLAKIQSFRPDYKLSENYGFSERCKDSVKYESKSFKKKACKAWDFI